MPDNLQQRGPADGARININQPHEVVYWTKALGVSEAKLSQAVQAVGPMVEDVQQWISENNQ